MEKRELHPAQHYNDELLNSSIRELITSRPQWIVRKGNIVFLVLIAGIFFLCWLIKYPEIIKTTAYFSGSHPVYAELRPGAATSGKIRPGQKVVVKIINDSTGKTVYLTGKVVSISLHKGDSLLALADFTCNKNSVCLKDFKTPAEIIIGNKRVLSNLIEQLKKMWQ